MAIALVGMEGHGSLGVNEPLIDAGGKLNDCKVPASYLTRLPKNPQQGG